MIIRYDKDKNSKWSFYLKGIANTIIPHSYFIKNREYFLNKYKNDGEFLSRLEYYNKTESFVLENESISIREFYKVSKKTYFFDMIKTLKYFPSHFRFNYLFGDITYVPYAPTFLKSRPIDEENNNSVILKLNSVRHYIFVKDDIPFDRKISKAVWRGKCYKPHRQKFVQKFYDKNFCNIGQTNTKGNINVPWQKEKLSISEQLKYKYIISIEGNDVASNLKWAMSSNSLVMMAKPKYETWFMEGILKPNIDYVLLKDDYSDMEEKILYYNNHPKEAVEIINNSHNHVQKFLDDKKELALSIAVAKKYFLNCGYDI